MPTGETKTRHVLIVEDEMQAALKLEDMLVELGHVVVAVATHIMRALTLASESKIDFAILDLNLAGTLSFPVADVLRRRDLPFMFASGYGNHGLTESYRNEFVLVKPYGLHELEEAIRKVVTTPAVL
jgi:DNA-binding response OmpR family regulator